MLVFWVHAAWAIGHLGWLLGHSGHLQRSCLIVVQPLLLPLYDLQPQPITCLVHHAGRTVETVREDLQHLMDQYGSSPALLRIAGRPVYYMYDSYRIPADAWAKLLTPHDDLTVRGTDLDGEWWGRGVGWGVGCGVVWWLRVL